MNGALLLIGILVCVSMTETEASSVKWAKNPFKAIQHRQFKANIAQGRKLNK